MPIFYLTFSRRQVHEFDDKRFDHACVGMVEDDTYIEARRRVLEVFGNDWDQLSKDMPNLRYYPRGLIEVTK